MLGEAGLESVLREVAGFGVTWQSPVPFLGRIGSGAGFCSLWLSSGRTDGNFKVQCELVVVVATKCSE